METCGVLKGMKVIDPSTIVKYERTLQKDPKSKVFAALADAYREVGKMELAEEVARRGLQTHPDYVGGYVALGRVLFQTRRFDEAVPVLQKAVQVSPENLLAYQLLGSCFVELKNPKEALKAHKMALFLNPLSERSQQAVRKLEILSAEEFNREFFEDLQSAEAEEETPFTYKKVSNEKTPKLDPQKISLERELSFIDALILRGEIPKAKEHLQRLQFKGHHGPEIDQRLDLVSSEEDEDDLLGHSPKMARKLELDHKIKVLKNLLVAVSNKRVKLMET